MKIVLLLLLTFGILLCALMSGLNIIRKRYWQLIKWQTALFMLTILLSVIAREPSLVRTMFFPVMLLTVASIALLNKDIASAGKNPKPKIGKSQGPKG